MKNKIIYIIAGLAFLVLAYFAVSAFAKKQKEKKLLKGGLDASGTLDADGNEVIQNVSKKDIATELQNIKNTPVAEIAQQIWNAKGVFNDDEDAVYLALSRLKSRVTLTLLTDYFKGNYGTTLTNYLQSFLDQSEMGKVNEILKKLK